MAIFLIIIHASSNKMGLSKASSLETRVSIVYNNSNIPTSNRIKELKVVYNDSNDTTSDMRCECSL